MLGSFDALRRGQDARMPQAMLDFFNSEVPDGLSYRYADEDESVCLLTPDDKARGFEVLGYKLALTDEEREAIGSDGCDLSKIHEYMDDTLRPVEMDIRDAEIATGGEAIPATRLTRTIDDDNHAGRGKFLLLPPEPVEFDMPYECDGSELVVHFKQIKSERRGTRRFESTDTALAISLEMRREGPSIRCGYRFDNTREPVSDRCLEAARVFKGLGDGSAKIKGYGVINPDDDGQGKEQGADLVDFWSKVVELEAALGTRFDASAEVSGETAANVARLHACIVEGRAVGLGFMPASVTAGEAPADMPQGERMALMLPWRTTLNVFGEALEVGAVVGLVGIGLGTASANESGTYEYPLEFSGNWQCTILYLASDETDDSEENVAHIRDTLTAALPDGRHF